MRAYQTSITMRRFILRLGGSGLILALIWLAGTKLNLNPWRTEGEEIDRHNGVVVYFNGGIGHSSGRNMTADGYNLGLKHQCVEFVKRYYFQHLNHRMPDTYGHAKDFFDPEVADGALNPRRNLRQHRNGGSVPPQPDDILVFGPTFLNPYGHVAIVVKTEGDHVEVIQQNAGPFGVSREQLQLLHDGKGWRCGTSRILGWLRVGSDEQR